MRFPEATCEARVVMSLTSTATEYRLKLDLTTSEAGEARWSRTWERTFPRDHQ